MNAHGEEESRPLYVPERGLVAWLLRQFRLVRRLERRIARLEQESGQLRGMLGEWKRFDPAGHFYSPLPSMAEIDEAFNRGGFGPPFPGVDLDEKAQFALLEEFSTYYPAQPFPEEKQDGRRFHLNNPSYGHFDAIMLYCMFRHAQPKRVIEVGSGFSSAAMLDLNEHVFGGRMNLTFIDPDMTRLRELLRPEDAGRVHLIEKKVQAVPVETFDALESGDVLFIDSSHVTKIGSDVNRLFFDVLPRLKPGVHVHVHDVAGNFEYPRDWLEGGRSWNEQYLLRAFLIYNRAFAVEMFSSWIMNVKREFIATTMPLCAKPGGGQIWLRRLA